MRRLVLVCLLLVLPLQWPWAVLASDCCPECACASEHPGGGARTAADGADDTVAVGCDTDCQHCQGPGPAALVDLPTLPVPVAGDRLRAIDVGPLSDRVPEHPLRPPQA